MSKPLIGPPGAPGAAPVPGDEMDPLQMEMMLQQAMYDLMQRPIIPDPLVFICAALYLIIVVTILICGAFYFVNRLKPLPPPAPAEETETTATYTEDVQTTTEYKPWNEHVDKNDLENTLTREYGNTLNNIGAGYLCCSLSFEDLRGALSSVEIGGDCKLKVGNDTDISVATEYIDNTDCNNMVIELGDAKEAEIKRLAPVLGKANYILYAPTPMTTQDLAQLRTSLLPNNFQGLPGSRSLKAAAAEKVLEAAKKIHKVCVMFTVAAMNSSGVGKGGSGPANLAAASVTPTYQSEVCKIAGLQYDRTSMSFYRKGNNLISFDTNKTIAKKVKTVLKKFVDVCIAAYDVQFDDCNDQAPALTETISAAFKKLLRRR